MSKNNLPPNQPPIDSTESGFGRHFADAQKAQKGPLGGPSVDEQFDATLRPFINDDDTKKKSNDIPVSFGNVLKRVEEVPSKQDTIDVSSLDKLKNVGLVVGATLLSAAVAVVGINTLSGDSRHEAESKLLQSPKIFTGNVELAEGINLRDTPYYQNAFADVPSNVVRKTTEGVTMHNPIVHKDEYSGETWYGSTDTDTDNGVVWVNATRLQRDEQTSGKAYIEVTPEGSSNKTDSNYTGTYNKDTGELTLKGERVAFIK